jgi:hypothetical protein
MAQARFSYMVGYRLSVLKPRFCPIWDYIGDLPYDLKDASSLTASLERIADQRAGGSTDD